MKSIPVTLLPGDGIGPEITDSVVAVFKAAGVPVSWDCIPIGLDSFQATGELVPKAAIESLKATGVGLKGPTTTPIGGGHRSINVTLRQEFELYANVRPVKTIPGIETPFKDIDLVIVRENTEDLYKGVEYKISPDIAQSIKIITRGASERIGHYAFQYASKHGRKRVTIVHKANIMKQSDGLFLEAIRSVAPQYPGITLDDVIVDACCMQLVRAPQKFDVIVTENLYGDILSDLASGLIGGLGVASGANYGKDCAIFEAVHGSAPDIAGKGLANPSALLLSGVSMLRHLGLMEHAQRIETAVLKALARSDSRTRDLGGELDTKAFTAKLIELIK